MTSDKYFRSCETLIMVPLNSLNTRLMTGLESGLTLRVGSSSNKTLHFSKTNFIKNNLALVPLLGYLKYRHNLEAYIPTLYLFDSLSFRRLI